MLLEKIIIAASTLLWGVKSASPKAFAPVDLDPVRYVDPVLPRPATAVRPEPVVETRIARRILRPEKAVQLLIRYLQESKAAGVYAASEIDEQWDNCCDHYGLEPIPHASIRSGLQALPGCYIGRCQLRLNYPEVRRRIKRDRAILYRIPARGQPAAGLPQTQPGRPGKPPAATAQSAGHDLASDYHDAQLRRVVC